MILIGIIMNKPEYKYYDHEDPEDISHLVKYVLATMAKEKKLPRFYNLEDCFGMAYIQAVSLAKTFDSEKGFTFEGYLFKYLPNRFYDYFTTNEVGKKKNLTRDGNGNVCRPKDGPRFVDKAITNFTFHSENKYEPRSGSSHKSCFETLESTKQEYREKDHKIVFSKLNKKQMDVIHLIARGVTQRDIGKILKVTESRVCQLRKEAKLKCRIESKAYTLEDNEYSI